MCVQPSSVCVTVFRLKPRYDGYLNLSPASHHAVCLLALAMRARCKYSASGDKRLNVRMSAGSMLSSYGAITCQSVWKQPTRVCSVLRYA